MTGCSTTGQQIALPPRAPETPRFEPDPTALQSKYRKPASDFLKHGLCQWPRGLTAAQVTQCRREVYTTFVETMDGLKRLDLLEDLQKRGFTHFKMRHSGRYDMALPEFDLPEFSFLRDNAPWLPLVRGLLGADCVLAHCGVMLSLPGSETQPWHSDGDHLSSVKQLPPHCINVFIPLVDITPQVSKSMHIALSNLSLIPLLALTTDRACCQNGGTEMVPGTHFTDSYDRPNPPTIPLVRAGECMLFDFRLRHRGWSRCQAVRRLPCWPLTLALT